MSIESLSLYIKEKTQDRIAETIRDANDSATKIIQDAESEASRVKEETLSKLKKEMDEKERAELSQARIEGKKLVMQVKESYLQKVSSETFNRLKAMAENEDSDYVRALLGFATEAVSNLGGSQVLVFANARDGNILRKHLPAIKEAASQSRRENVVIKLEDEPIDVVGGVLAQTNDGRKVFGNTLETRIDSTLKKLRGELLAVLFEGEESRE
jgi:vacuolar-type H+-ATPase subunit E/Vma4